MALAAGTKIGSYEVVAKIGAGGMGEVYRARDLKLGRDVALKVISGELAHDEQRMGRFQREAQVLASLNHPRIAAIYGLEDSTGVPALVMELVEGPTLSERIAGGPIAAEDALPIAREIAEALEAAHERGIVHRDLKPANIKLTQDGNVKVLDFGLAKALQDDPSSGDMTNSPTLTMGSTKAGVILGTAAYMSPEQAKGRPADRRADIWSFGVVLYEMLTGKQAFGGETISDSLAAIIKDTPDWSALPPRTPAKIVELLQRCLQKDAKQRLQAIGDARIAIDEVLAGKTSIPGYVAVADAPSAGAGPAVKPAPSLAARIFPWAVAAAFALGLAAALFFLHRGSGSRAHAVQLDFPIAAGQQLDPTNGPAFAISPDGLRVAYVTNDASQSVGRLYIRELDKSDAIELDAGALVAGPFFSPDSQWLAYFCDGKLKKVSVRGGTPTSLADVTAYRGGTWSDDGTIVYPGQFTGPLLGISANGGSPTAYTKFDAARGDITHRWPQFLPDGKNVLFTVSGDNNVFTHATVEVASAGGASKILVENGYYGRYFPPGYLAYVSQGTLFVAPFDAGSLKLTGAAIPVLQNLQSDLSSGAAQFDISRTGTLIYLAGGTAKQSQNIVQLDRKGNTTILLKDEIGASAPRYSPDGKRFAFQKMASGIWIYDFARGLASPLTVNGGTATYPVWSPDGQWLAYEHNAPTSAGLRQLIFAKRADGSSSEVLLTPGFDVNAFPTSWSPDGKLLMFERASEKDGACCEAWVLPVGKDGKPGTPTKVSEDADSGLNARFVASFGSSAMPDFSPDGRWLSYIVRTSSNPSVYVVPFPERSGKWLISNGWGVDSRWSRTRNEIFFLNLRELNVVSYTVDHDVFVPGTQQVLFRNVIEPRAPYPSYDVSPDGQHFIAFQAIADPKAELPEPTVILDWIDALRPQVAAGEADSTK